MIAGVGVGETSGVGAAFFVGGGGVFTPVEIGLTRGWFICAAVETAKLNPSHETASAKTAAMFR